MRAYIKLAHELLDFIQPRQNTCLRCGDRYFSELDEGLCEVCALHARHVPPADLQYMREGLKYGRELFDYVGAAYYYSDGVRQRVHALKYGAQRQLGIEMGLSMAKVLERLDEKPEMLPVPLHWLRRLRRGYNQAEVLAQGIAMATGLNINADMLERCRRTRSNARLSHEKRAANVRHAFRLRGNPNGGRYLIVDDVLTTGSTAAQCARLLRRGGAVWVGVIAYARAGNNRSHSAKAGNSYTP